MKFDKGNMLVMALVFVMIAEVAVILSFAAGLNRGKEIGASSVVPEKVVLSNDSYEKGLIHGSIMGWNEGYRIIVYGYYNCTVEKSGNDTLISWNCLISKWDERAQELNEQLNGSDVA